MLGDIIRTRAYHTRWPQARQAAKWHPLQTGHCRRQHLEMPSTSAPQPPPPLRPKRRTPATLDRPGAHGRAGAPLLRHIRHRPARRARRRH
eukprot:10575084-Alexandrium_andersonii.AAC.1